jgi:hypothetical protein
LWVSFCSSDYKKLRYFQIIVCETIVEVNAYMKNYSFLMLKGSARKRLCIDF